jgi:bacillithiol system protein YtxJ
VAQKFGIEHESPQALLIKNGKATYTASHFEIDYRTIQKHLN